MVRSTHKIISLSRTTYGLQEISVSSTELATPLVLHERVREVSGWYEKKQIQKEKATRQKPEIRG